MSESIVSTPTLYAGHLEQALTADPETINAAELHGVISTIDFATKQLRSEIESGYHDIQGSAMHLLSRSLHFISRLEQRFPAHVNINAIRESIQKRLEIIAPKKSAA
jgi:hypothetical protein